MSQKRGIIRIADLLGDQSEVIHVIDGPVYEIDIDKLLSGWAKKRLVHNIHGVEIDVTKIKDRRYFVKKAYQILSSRVHPEDSNVTQWRMLLVQCLENLLNTEFRNTKDLRQKVEKYLRGYDIRKGTTEERLHRARKKEKLTQKQLATKLGYKNHVAIAQFEKGLRYPPKKVFEWLEGVESAA